MKFCSCTTPGRKLDGPLKFSRSREHTELALQALPPATLWKDYGIIHDVIASLLPSFSKALTDNSLTAFHK
jgi:hypothetical protein